MIFVKEGVTIYTLPFEVLKMLKILSVRSAADGRPVVITGKEGDPYRLDGAHVRGYALDIRADATVGDDKLFFWKVKQDFEREGLKVQMLFGGKDHMDHCHIHLVKGTESGK